MAEVTPHPDVIRTLRYRARDTSREEAVELPVTSDRRDDLTTRRQCENLVVTATSTLEKVPPSESLGYFSTSSLITNKVVGTGIFVQPATVLALVGSKGASLMLWLVGSFVAWAGMTVYLEYGIRFPLSGGELYYFHYIWRRPHFLVTYMYSLVFVVLSGSQANALQFGASVITASTSPGTPIDYRVQKFIAIVIVGAICLLQTYSRNVIVHLNNAIAAYKLLFLLLITLLGFCALRGVRTSAASATGSPYGTSNLRDIFAGTSMDPYGWGLALLVVQRAYLGYENANFVLEEVRRPAGNPDKVFRRTATVTILVICVLYIMTIFSFFAACSTDELLEAPDVPSLFFSKVFGPSPNARTASAVLIAIAAAGNIMAFTFAAVTVKQEIARLGILPYPEFFAKSTHRGTPGPALLLHFVFTSIFVLASPLSDPNGFLVISTLFVYARTWIAMALGVALLAAPRIKAFRHYSESWTPCAWSWNWIGWMQLPLTLLYIFANTFIMILYWFPPGFHSLSHIKSSVLSSYAGPVVGTVFYVAGAVYWVWDMKALRRLGWKFEVLPERVEGFVVTMKFDREISGISEKCYNFVKRIAATLVRFGGALSKL